MKLYITDVDVASGTTNVREMTDEEVESYLASQDDSETL